MMLQKTTLNKLLHNSDRKSFFDTLVQIIRKKNYPKQNSITGQCIITLTITLEKSIKLDM